MVLAGRADWQRRQQSQADVEVQERQQRDGVKEPAADAHAVQYGALRMPTSIR